MDGRDCVRQCRPVGEGGQRSTGVVQSSAEREDKGLVSKQVPDLN